MIKLIFLGIFHDSHSKALTYPYVNSDSTKYSWINYWGTYYEILVFHPTNGSIIESKQLSYSTSFSSSINVANGWISDDMIVLSMYTSSENSNLLDFINTTDWTLISYKGSSQRKLNGFSSLFNTNQIILLFGDSNNQVDYTLQIAYNKLNMTEFFTQ